MPETHSDDQPPDEKKFSVAIKIAADETRPFRMPRRNELARKTRLDFDTAMASSEARLSQLMPDGRALDITDPNFIKNLNQRDFIETDAAAQVMLWLTLFGQKSVERSVVDPETGEVTIESVLVPDDDIRVKAGKVYIQLQTLKLLQTKQATAIVSVQVTEMSDEIAERAAAKVLALRERLKPKMLHAEVTTPALPEKEAVEGELVLRG